MMKFCFLSLVSVSALTVTPHVHTLLLCRHGDSIWNGGQEGLPERFTGWTDCPLSGKGELEALDAAHQLSTYNRDIDVCFTSTLQRAQHTADICLDKLQKQQKCPQVVQDVRLNERHYGALQGLIKQEVQDGLHGHPSHLVDEWRRSWHAQPPPMPDNDPRLLQQMYTHGTEYCPNGESLEMVAEHRIRPFLKDTMLPMLERMDRPTTGLIVAHANSLRALIGVLCNVQGNRKALRVLESLKIPTGVPLVMHCYSTTSTASSLDDDNFRALCLPEPDECIVQDPTSGFFHPPQQPPPNLGHASLPVWPLDACIPVASVSMEQYARQDMVRQQRQYTIASDQKVFV